MSDIYDAPGIRWALRMVGPHLHPNSEDATVALAARAEAYGLVTGGRLLEVASALGGPSRYLARRFGGTVLCLDADPRMHAAAAPAIRSEGLVHRCLPLLARAERMPLADACCDGAWSQDALCHMDKAAVLREVARVLRPGGVFAFTDWLARATLSDQETDLLRQLWAFPSLFTLPDYVHALATSGFRVLLAEDRTESALARPRPTPPDQEVWMREFAAELGPAELERQQAPGRTWQALMAAGRTGYGLFVATRHPGDVA